MSFLGWLAVYLLIGLVLGEGAIAACKRRGSPLTAPGYLMLVLLWFVVLAAWAAERLMLEKDVE